MLLACSFSVVVMLKKKAKENNLKYQLGNCKELFEVNGDALM
jgi:hypothetical protein